MTDLLDRGLLDEADQVPVGLVGATCGCILATDLGVSTRVASALLELRRNRQEMTRIDVRRLLANQPHVATDAGLAPVEQEWIGDYPVPLHVYLPATHADPYTGIELVKPVLRELALMLGVYHRCVHRSGPTLHLCHQVAVQAFRARAAQNERPQQHPIGRFARAIGRHHARSATARQVEGTAGWRHAEALVSAPPGQGYERVEALRSTQLRTLMLLGMAVAGGYADAPLPWSLADVYDSDWDDRQRLLNRLRNIVTEGLTAPPPRRTPYMHGLLGRVAAQLVQQSDDQVLLLAEWLAAGARDADPDRATACNRTLWGVLRDLSPSDDQRTRLDTVTNGLWPAADRDSLKISQYYRGHRRVVAGDIF